MKPEQFIREFGVDKARGVVKRAPDEATHYRDLSCGIRYTKNVSETECYVWTNSHWRKSYVPEIIFTSEVIEPLSDLKRLVESLDRYNKFDSKQEALDAIDEAPEGATDYRKLSCGTRYIKQGPRFFEYWNGSEWCRPTVPFTVETHILRFDKLDDLKQAIKDHESIYGGGENA